MVVLNFLWTALLLASGISVRQDHSSRTFRLSSSGTIPDSRSRRSKGLRPPKKPYLKTDHLLLQRIRENNGLVWVDLENVRGKSGFALTHWQVLEQTSNWMKHHDLTGHVIVVADHGSVETAYYSHALDLAIAFSGNHQKADDVLARSVGIDFWQPQPMPNTDAAVDRTIGESMIVTADAELRTRCRRAFKKTLHMMEPTKFIDDMEASSMIESAKGDSAGDSVDNTTVTSTNSVSIEESLRLGKLDEEIRLRAQILDTQVQLDQKRKTMTNKRRKKLQTKLDGLRSKLASRGPSLLDQVTSLPIAASGRGRRRQRDYAPTTTIAALTSEASSSPLSSRDQELILKRWQEIQQTSSRKEQTGDRVILAERLRRQLVEQEDVTNNLKTVDSPSKAYIMYMNKIDAPIDSECAVGASSIVSGNFAAKAAESVDYPQNPRTIDLLSDPSTNPLQSLDTIKIVAISDTHGFQGQLLRSESDSNDQPIDGIPKKNDRELLPEGDLLIHLGDFAVDGNKEKQRDALNDFDEWMAKQPHPIKIVVRGNHDPWWVDFKRSGAWFLPEPTTITLMENLVLGVIPYGSSRKLNSSKGLPKSCQILATHVPPLNTLDRTFTGKSAGSGFLTKIVRGMKSGAPNLWLCGHIHEGRGIAERQFGSVGPTVVVNAANANPGRATYLEHDAAVIQVKPTESNNNSPHRMLPPIEVQVLEMKHKTISEQISSQRDFVLPDSASTPAGVDEQLLLAIDLGLKSGLALFGSRDGGRLLRYEQFHFDRDTLQDTAKRLVADWEASVNQDNRAPHDGEKRPHVSAVTHVAVEGADGYLLRAWAEAIPEVSLLRVSPEEWRADLLLEKERTSGSNAKAASRMIARQVVDRVGTMPNHQGKFPTDVAEAVCLGWFVTRQLGWTQTNQEGSTISNDPAVRRYTNGNIVVPKRS